MRPCPLPLSCSNDDLARWASRYRTGGWPAASSFPDLEGCPRTEVGLAGVLAWQRVSGIDTPWCSGTSFPDLG